MNSSLQIVKKIIQSTEDQNQLKGIPFDEEKIKNLNQDFSNIVVKKPWGYEYLFYTSRDLSIWVLKILKNQKTSMHCHRGKKTSLILLEGEAKLYTLNGTLELKSGNVVTIDQGAFHRTSSEYNKDILVMEIETPTNKNDIIRLKDEYNRSNSGYETKKFFSKINNNTSYLNYSNAKKESIVLGKYEISIIEGSEKIFDYSIKENLLCPIKSNLNDKSAKKGLGEIYDQKFNNIDKNLLTNFQEFLVIKKK